MVNSEKFLIKLKFMYIIHCDAFMLNASITEGIIKLDKS